MEDVVLSISRLLSSPKGNAVMSLSRETGLVASSHVCLHYKGEVAFSNILRAVRKK
jgi:hypothetical protein